MKKKLKIHNLIFKHKYSHLNKVFNKYLWFQEYFYTPKELLFRLFELEVEVLKGLKTFESFLKLYLWYLGSSLALKC